MQSSAPARRFFTLSRVWDGVAILVVAYALWKIFIAPRSFAAPGALIAPHVVYQRLNGDTFRLADQRGHTIFLDFYASWCTPCKAELPLVEAWQRKHAQVAVVPVDVGEQRSAATAFARQMQLGDIALDPTGSARALFGIQGFPTILVIDRNGYVRAKWEGLNPAIALAMSNAENRL